MLRGILTRLPHSRTLLKHVEELYHSERRIEAQKKHANSSETFFFSDFDGITMAPLID
jgi:catechol-2,3-dioxygenase